MKSSGLLYWLPRILVILTIFIVGLFSLDSFSPDQSLWHNLGSFLMNLLPAFVLAIILIVAWKWERVGGIILTILGIVFTVLVFNLNFRRNHSVLASLLIVLIICIPSLVAGILFLISGWKKGLKEL